MQYPAYLIVNNKKIKVLVRDYETYKSFKIRKSGFDGIFMEEESKYLSQPQSDIKYGELYDLLNGKVVKL
jgi:ASC-1-like (ASCH) protein